MSNYEEGGLGGFIAVCVAIVLVIGAVLFFTGSKKPPQDKTCISYGGGVFEGNDYQRTVSPGGGRSFNGIMDKWYCYPTETERSYIITSRPGEGDAHYADTISAPSADNIPLNFELALYFRLNEAKLEDFHSSIGIKTSAYKDDGWRSMLAEYVRPQIDQAVQRLARQYEAVEAYADETVFRAMQANLAAQLPDAITEALGDDYFTQFRVVLRHVGIPQGLVAELEANKASEIAVKTKQNEIRQAEAEAEAIQKRQKALEGCEVCILYEAIKSGSIDFWVIPSGNELTLQTPQRNG